MKSSHWAVVSLTLLCGCGRQNAQPTTPATPRVQADTVSRDSDSAASPASTPPEGATDSWRPPAAAVAELRATLGRAFEVLRKQGIVAEPKFEDCMRCAVAAMSDLLKERNAPGGVYWHDQDDDALEQGEDLMIGFVARKDDDATAIAQKLVAALKAEGLTVEWDGSEDRRVTVKVPWTKPEAAADPPRV